MRPPRNLLRILRPVLVLCVAWGLRFLARSWRVRIEGPNPFDPVTGAPRGPLLAALWHRNLLIGAALYRDQGIAVPISRSRDGDLVAAVLTRLGWAPPPRGSDSRGASSVLRRAIALVGEGQPVGVLCDGPRGPARRAKRGVVAIAGKTGVPILPVAFGASPCTRFPSWDGTILPWPFARVVVRYGEPYRIEAALNDADRVDAVHRLDQLLNEMTDAVDPQVAGSRSVAGPADPPGGNGGGPRRPRRGGHSPPDDR